MVSYYNTLSYSQKHSAANLTYAGGQPWQWPANYHTPPNHQFLGDMDSPHHHQMYYSPHHMFHPAASTSDWHTPSESFSQNAQNHMLQQVGGGGGSGATSLTGTAVAAAAAAAAAASAASGITQLNEPTNREQQHIAEGLPSPPITVSGSELSSPGAPVSSSSPHHHHQSHNLNNSNNSNHNKSFNSTNINNNNSSSNNNREPSPVKSPYYEWMKKPSYPAQPTPGPITDDDTRTCTTSPPLQDFTTILEARGKTRTKDKYRVVYTDFQRLELEKEYCTSRYITIRRKTELASTLQLSERQVKIWFQNRRAKERKQTKKSNDPTLSVQHSDLANYMETKPKIEPGLHHLQHPALHQMSSMAMGMPPMSLHHLHGHHPLSVPPPSTHSHSHSHAHSHSHSHAHSHAQHLHQPHSQMSAASVGSLSM